MAFIFLIIWVKSYFIQASQLIHYKFGSNFGQIFFDYSGSGNHGQNGNSINSYSYDTIPFDRGAYFYGANTYIMLPPNDIQSTPLYLMNSFSIIIWTYFIEVGYNYYLTFRVGANSEYLYIIRMTYYDNFQTLIYNRGYAPYEFSLVYNTASSGIKYIGKWICISMIVDGLTAKYYSNDILFTTINLSINYYETSTYTHYIGCYVSSLIGFVWSFYLFDEVVLPTGYYSSTYTGTNCLAGECPLSCSPAIKENGQDYCISNSVYSSCLGCSYGCKDGICLNCNDFYTKSCIVESNEILYICPQATSSTPCSCVDGYFLYNNYYTCKRCYGECSTCNSGLKCSTCKDINSEVHIEVGCYCKNGFYNISALINSGSCRECQHDCAECTSENICISCKSLNSIPHATNGCVCNEGYYNSTTLSLSTSCIKCYPACKSCDSSEKCLTCKALNSTPRSDFGCECIKGYYNLSSLEDQGICLECHSNCEICTEELLCVKCKDLNSKSHSTVGCVCKEGFYNTSELTSTDSCKPCFSECKSCSSEFICDECIDSNSTKMITGGCLCNERFYNTTQVTSQGLCLECHHECKTCNDSSKCLTCSDMNAFASPQSGCTCIEKFYKESNSSCQKCHLDCQVCSNSSYCDQCVDDYASVNGSQCFCNLGYYNSSIDSKLVCKPCPVNCTACLSATQCIKCSFNQMSRLNGVCKCPPDSTLREDSCFANPGYFISNDSVSDFVTLPCDKTCETCFDFGSNKCYKCANNIQLKDDKCEGCPEKKYLDRTLSKCINCSEDCATCLNSSHCLTCANPSFILKDGKCLYPCTVFEYLNDSECKDCPALCEKCDPICKICVENSNLVNDSICECSKGFKASGHSCVEQYFSASLIIKSINLAEVYFTEPLEKLIKEADYEFMIVNRSDFKVTLMKNDTQNYTFSMIFEKEVQKGTEIQVKILQEKVYSVKNSLLADHLLTSNLPSYVPVYVSPSVQVILGSTKAAAQTVVSSSIGASLVSNPAAAWALLNSIQILVFLPLSSNQMTPNVRIFLSGFSGYNLLPNILGSWFSENASSDPYFEAKKYGIKSSVFLLNTGKTFMILVSAFILWPLVFAISKCKKGKITVKALKILGNFRYSFFLRFWIQAYLEILIFGIVQLRSRVLIPAEGHFNQLLAALACLAGVLTLPFIFISFYVSAEKIKNGSENFNKKWGSLFVEFKNNKGFWSSQYYFLYFSRRLAFAFSQIYLNSLLFVQGGVNLAFSLMTLVFIFYYKPFKDTTILISTLVGEISITLVMIFTFMFLWDLSMSVKELLEMMIIFTVLSGMLIQILISMYSFYKSVQLLWKKIEKVRGLEFAHRFESAVQIGVRVCEKSPIY